MPRYEYKVVPAPKKAARVRGVKGTEARFAHALAEIMNAMGTDGWEYQRTDSLPCEARSTFGSKSTTFQNMLIFRRAVETDTAPSLDVIASAHMPEPAPPAVLARVAAPDIARPAPVVPRPGPERAPDAAETLPAARMADPSPRRPETPAGPDPAPTALPSFRSVKAGPPPAGQGGEGRTPRLGAATRP